jgi:hypothetical protein
MMSLYTAAKQLGFADFNRVLTDLLSTANPVPIPLGPPGPMRVYHERRRSATYIPIEEWTENPPIVPLVVRTSAGGR